MVRSSGTQIFGRQGPDGSGSDLYRPVGFGSLAGMEQIPPRFIGHV